LFIVAELIKYFAIAADKKRYEIETAIFTLKAAMKCFKFKVIRNGTLPSTMDHLHIKASDPQFPNTECGSYLGRMGGEQVSKQIISSDVF